MIAIKFKTIFPDVSPKQRVKVRIELREITKTIPENLHEFSMGDVSGLTICTTCTGSSGTSSDVLIAHKLSVVQYSVKKLNVILDYFHRSVIFFFISEDVIE